jgi:hypothetical protein
MAWTNVCKAGVPAGGLVREDDIKSGDSASAHDAGGPSPGILNFLAQVVTGAPSKSPTKPADFPTAPHIDTYPGRAAADVHFEGRAADVFLSFNDPKESVWGNWLFDWCVANCQVFNIQGVIFGNRQWFSEAHGGQPTTRNAMDHLDHVHVELNCDGAAGTGSGVP